MKYLYFTILGLWVSQYLLFAQTVLINEIDTDQTSTDAAEFIELYDGGTGITALDGYVLVLFNGSDDQSYAAFDLDGYSTDANGFFVLGNAAVPGVDLIFSNTILQNGSDAVALYQDDASSFPGGTPVSLTNLVDAVVYDTNDPDDVGLLVLLNSSQAQLNEDVLAAKDVHSLQRYPDAAGGSRNTSAFVSAIPTPGTFNVNVTTRLQEEEFNDCVLSPIPFRDHLCLETEEQVRMIRISDVTGRCVKQCIDYSSEQPILTNELSAGTYIVTIVLQDGSEKSLRAIKR